MAYIVLTLIGFLGGGFCVYLFIEQKRRALDAQHKKQVDQARRLSNALTDIEAQQQAVRNQSLTLQAAQTEYDARIITYQELVNANALLTTDLRNLYFAARSHDLDIEQSLR